MEEEQRASELRRARRLYEERDRSAAWSAHWSILDPAVHFAVVQRERAVLRALARYLTAGLGELKALDVGCGSGGTLLRLVGYGAEPGNLAGVDLSYERIERAKQLVPAADLRCLSADKLPFDNNSFDLVLQFTLFSSVMDPNLCESIAAEMLRVLSPNGLILWYDMRADWLLGRWVWGRLKKDSKDTIRWISRRDIARMFPDCDVRARSATLFDPIARMVARRSWMACELLEKIAPLRSHWLAVITKAGGHTEASG